MNFIVQGPSPSLYLRYLRYTRTILPIPTLATHTRAIHIWHAISSHALKRLDNNRKIFNYKLFEEYTDPKKVQLGLWTKEDSKSRPAVSWLSLADVLEQHLGPGQLLVPRPDVDENVKNERPGVGHYYIREMKLTTYRKITRRDRGTGSKEIRINQGAPTEFRENLMSRAWQFAMEHIPVEFHIGFSGGKQKQAKNIQAFVERMNDPNELHLRPDVTLKALPWDSYMALPPSSDGRTEVCWVVCTLRDGETYESKLDGIRWRTEFMRGMRLEVETAPKVEMPQREGSEVWGGSKHPEAERGEMALKEEQTKGRDRLKVREDYQSFLRERDAMYKRLDREFPLISPIVKRLAPRHASSEQLLKLAHLISYKLPHVKKLATEDSSVYKEICATMRLEETKDQVQARIQELRLKLGQDGKTAVEPRQRSSKVRHPNDRLTHPLLLGTKTFNPNESYCFRCGEVPCTREHAQYCNAPPDKWLSKWESDMLQAEVLRRRGPSPQGTDKSDTKKTLVGLVKEPTQSFQTRPANWRRNDGTIDVDAFRDSLQEESSSVESSEMDTSDFGPAPDSPLDGVVRRVGHVQPYQSLIKEKPQTYQQDYNSVRRVNLESAWPSEDVNGQDSPLGEESKKIQTVAPSKETIKEHTRRDSSAKEKQYGSQANFSIRRTSHITPPWTLKGTGIIRTIRTIGEPDTAPAADTAEPLINPFAAKNAERLHREFHARARMLRREATELEKKTQKHLTEAEKENKRLKKDVEAIKVEAIQGRSERLKRLPSNVAKLILDPSSTKRESTHTMETPEKLAALRRENGVFQRTLVRYHHSEDAIPDKKLAGLGDIKLATIKPFEVWKSRRGDKKPKMGRGKVDATRPAWQQKLMKRKGFKRG
ncbi:hypothetical protein HYFRA_00010996 [Hymenoscyphus fraxineus]|uniref:Uncharacterized protein n=1 Tax=Hymenoscyphus fraxineus TaxID=746836 RepID=A0A9N9PU01_9HELO|nr:hypothetical protein HYFRA_00010996 [Hymenoscyphus fraxineus]